MVVKLAQKQDGREACPEAGWSITDCPNEKSADLY